MNQSQTELEKAIEEVSKLWESHPATCDCSQCQVVAAAKHHLNWRNSDTAKQLSEYRQQNEQLKGVPPGSPFSDEGCAFTYSDWMRVRQKVIDERDELKSKLSAVEAQCEEMRVALREIKRMNSEGDGSPANAEFYIAEKALSK